MYQDLYNKTKKMVKKDACMKFYNVARPLYLETDTSSISLGARLLEVRNDMNCGCDEIPDNAILHLIACTRKSFSSAKWHYSNIEAKALGILHGLEKNYHL